MSEEIKKKVFWDLVELQLKHEPGEDSYQDVTTIAEKYNIPEDDVYAILGKGGREDWPHPDYPPLTK